MTGRRQALLAAVVYGLLALVIVAPGLPPGKALSGSDLLWSSTPWQAERPEGVKPGGENFELLDAVVQFQPTLEETRRRLPDIPLWNPHIMGGRSYIGNAQSAVFSPFSIPAYTLPFWSSFAVAAWLKLFVAAFGTFLLARALGMRWAAALLAGLVFGFGLYFVVWLSWPHSSVWAWLPWLLLLADRIARRPTLAGGVALAAVTGLQFLGGHPASSFHTLFATVAFFALRVVLLRREGGLPALPRSLVAFGAALAGGAALAAVAILPFAELVLQSADFAHRSDDPFRLPVEYGVSLMLPEFWGRPDATAFSFLISRAFYCGALPLLLAAIAVLLRPSRERVALAGFGAVCLAVALGISPFFQIVHALPGFETANNPRLAILVVMCVALLAGRGFDDLLHGERDPRRVRRAVVVAALIVAAPFAWLAVGRPAPALAGEALLVGFRLKDATSPLLDPDAVEVIRLGSLFVWLAFAGAALALIVARVRGRLGTTAFAALALGLVALDLFRAGFGYSGGIDTDHATQPVTPAVALLQEAVPWRFVGLGPRTLDPNLSMRYRLYDARGYDWPVEERYDRLWRSQVAPEIPTDFPQTLGVPRLTEERRRTLDLFSVRHVVQGPDEGELEVPGLRVVHDGRDARVYENTEAVPRAFLVGGQVVADGGEAALRAVTDPDFDPRAAVVTERRLAGVPEGPRRERPGSARLSRHEPERLRIEADVREPSVLVVTDAHYPGWKAYVDGAERPIERVDYLMRGVVLEPGRRTVEMRYEPATWRAAWIVSATAALLLLGLLAVSTASRRRSGRGAARPDATAGRAAS